MMMRYFWGLGVGHVYANAKPQPYVTVVQEVQPSTSNHDLEPIEPELTLAEDEDDGDRNEAQLLHNGDSDDLDELEFGLSNRGEDDWETSSESDVDDEMLGDFGEGLYDFD